MSNRRDFLSRELPMMFKEVYQAAADIFVAEDKKKELKYFRSFKSCYPFLAEVSIEEIRQDAMEMGIDPTGKSKLELARLIYNNE